ncbi:hypothetical protein RRG08_005431 [Elysia crispata]|uniref:Uncharacterized protein n=1 Tax=Elysia crispata TaxID=231223 RepID=A0AAE0Y0Y0_9GAST|nr:hypothetical protein RRG08_005431 [Elysia crispata]
MLIDNRVQKPFGDGAGAIGKDRTGVSQIPKSAPQWPLLSKGFGNGTEKTKKTPKLTPYVADCDKSRAAPAIVPISCNRSRKGRQYVRVVLSEGTKNRHQQFSALPSARVDKKAARYLRTRQNA